MNWLALMGLMALNFAISWFNAWSVGRSWVEAKQVGGWLRFMAWMGATMSACGFTWCYLIVLAIVARGANAIDDQFMQAMLGIGYLVIIGPVIGSGLAITVDSWAHFYRERSFFSGAVATYNTASQLHNLYEAAQSVPGVWKMVGEAFGEIGSLGDDDDDKGKGAMAAIAILLVVVALAGGALTTTAIIRATMRSRADSLIQRFDQRRRAA